MAMTTRERCRLVGSGALFAAAAGLLWMICGCSDVEKAPPRPRPANPNATVAPDISPMMRGTVASVARLDGWRDTVVEGYGLVVNLEGTGHRTLNANIRSHMINEMSRRGVGSESSGFNVSPELVLDSPDTAVVLVKAIIPPGATEGESFDVHVSKLPNTETTSLEGGLLWTTDLRPSLGVGLPPTGSRQARAIARAYGHIFTNPFVDPGVGAEGAVSSGGAMVDTSSGRIIGGGVAIRDLPLKLRLNSPSHNIASILQQVINSQFPQEPGQKQATAWGESDESIELTVPPSYHGRQREFVRLIEHTSIGVTGVQGAVEYVNRVLQQSPGEADHASWRWQALGRQALASMKQFYNAADERPRYAALRAGAKLNDALVTPHLIELARNGSSGIRKQALNLLGEMRTDPRIILELEEILDDPSTDIRVAAYEALDKQRSSLIRTMYVAQKYRVDFVESKRPLVYVALLEEPRIVVFGENLEIDTPMTVSAWSDRFLMKGDLGRDALEVAYLDLSGEHVVYRDVPAKLNEFIPFLGHDSTIEDPAPGLGLTYGETIGVLYALHQADYLEADFFTEADRLNLAILDRQQEPAEYEERREFSEDEPATLVEPAPRSGDGGGENESELRSEFEIPN